MNSASIAPVTPYRFQVALSFPGEHRARVEQIANILASKLGEERVLYDKWYRAEFARPNLDVYLPNLYHRQARLLVFFLCGSYASKQWTGLEWRAGRDLLKQKEDDRLMFLRLDNAEIDGLYSTDGFIDITQLTDEDVSVDILKRLDMLAPAPRPRIEHVVNDLRARTKADILGRCGRIRVLSMEKSIDLGGVYTDVLMLEKRTANLRKTKDELISGARLVAFERFGLFTGETKRIPGLQLFDDERHIIIFGKPGAGKTTFLKHLATECAHGSFEPSRVPAFVTLREYADSTGRPTLDQFIDAQWRGSPNLLPVLDHGYGLILLDGLDEVRDRDFSRIRQAIEAFTARFPLCMIVLTCRIAAREYVFERFTEVEMADFTEEQIAIFASRWFRAYNEEKKAAVFLEKLRANRPVWELATSPLLLTLLCLVFRERNDFDGTRADLYKQGLDVLLHKWDGKRDIERDFAPGVGKSALEPLLAEIAYSRFVTGELFFEQSGLEKQIDDFFRMRNNLVPQGMTVNPSQVLNSIEAYLGLLVARAMNVYSFSHLTFQEYLTAQQVVRKPSLLLQIAPHIGHTHWREVWLLLATMLDADDIVLEMKTAVDLLVEKEQPIQAMLRWGMRKAERQGGYQPALRAFYHGLIRQRPQARVLELERDHDFKLARDLGLNSDFAFELGRNLIVARDLIADLARDLELDGELASNLAGIAGDPARDVARALVHALDRILETADTVAPELAKEIQTLRAELPGAHHASWERERLPGWRDRFRSAAIRHCDIGHEWGFDSRQLEILDEYYRANLLLLECMNGARALTKETRQYVTNTMVLPYDEIPLPV